MIQDNLPERDPLAEYWDIYGKRDLRVTGSNVKDLHAKWMRDPLYVAEYEALAEEYAGHELAINPWTSGRYALAVIVWGLIAMVVLSIPAGASGTGKKHPGTKVEAFVQKETKPKCLEPVRVVGSQDVRQDAAEDSARKAWAEIVRWESGESFMNIENATGYQSRCSRSSIGETLGVTLNRCEIIAKPCRPGLVEKGASK
jgi:hypothetical protein